jgi:hypothetical protein
MFHSRFLNIQEMDRLEKRKSGKKKKKKKNAGIIVRRMSTKRKAEKMRKKNEGNIRLAENKLQRHFIYQETSEIGGGFPRCHVQFHGR